MKILSMSGFVPEHVCDVVRFTQYSGERNIAHYCGYASDFISQVKNDESIDGAVFPKTCDSTRILNSYLNKTDKFTYQVIIPLHKDKEAVTYFAKVIKDYQEAVEKYYKTEILDIPKRLNAISVRNAEIAKIYKSIEKYRYSEYLKKIHDMLKKPLYEQNIGDLVQEDINGKPVFVIGSFLSNVMVMEQIERAGMQIVGDYLPESGRLVSNIVTNASGNIYEIIAQDILNKGTSPSQSDFKDILVTVLEECKMKGVKGVIFCVQKYCEPYEYFYNLFVYEAEKHGIRTLKLNFSDSEDSRKVSLLCEAFADTL